MATDVAEIEQQLERPSVFRWIAANPVLVVGMLSILVPTMIYVITKSWTTEQGAHGPIVLAAGLWLLWREWRAVRSQARPPRTSMVLALFIPLLILYFVARVSQIVELEGPLMYGLILVVLFSVVGGRMMALLWFPLAYLLFIFPPPETIVAVTTNPLKVALSQWVADLLHWLGYPIAAAGVTIQIGQYQLLVADACSGINSLISLAAIGLFYVYLLHHANLKYAFILFLTILPVAIFANFVRILFLVLLTYYGGESAAQGFLHDFAGMTTFFTALLTIFAIDKLLGKLFPKLRRGSGARADVTYAR
ncbi:MAG TPA: exosortase V [Sphingobium sp.]|nr:exosortase V [Sphingobium sp.]